MKKLWAFVLGAAAFAGVLFLLVTFAKQMPH